MKARRAIKKRKVRTQFCFDDSEFCSPVDIPPDDIEVDDDEKDDLSYFHTFFSSHLYKTIAEASTQYALQTTGSSTIIITEKDLEEFIVIELMMGIVKLPAYTDYWATDKRISYIADIMPLKKYQKIRKFLHFSDNSLTNDDRFFKVRSLLDDVRNNCLKIPNENNQSIDEMMVPYKGTRAGSRKQYMPMKPKKWGMKMYVRAGVSGLVYDFIIYGGDDTFRQHSFSKFEDRFDFGQKIVLALCQTMPNPELKAVYFDNFFTNLELIHYLREKYGILSLGTIRSNRLRGLKIEASTKKTIRGTSVEKADNDKKIVVVRWSDRKDVILASSFVGKEPVSSVMRYNKEEKKKVAIPCPAVVKKYNQHMGGVDKMDMLVALYRTEYRTHKWYMAVFSQILDICVCNAWLYKKRHQRKSMRLKDFRWEVARSLLEAGKAPSFSAAGPSKIIKKPTAPRPPETARLDGVGHLPTCSKKERCKFCKNGKTRVSCIKCKMALCLLPERNCFYLFHK